MNFHAFLDWVREDLTYKAPELWPEAVWQHLAFIEATYPDGPARVETPASGLSDDEMVAAIELCRVVVDSPDPEPIKASLVRLRVLLDRFPGTPTTIEGAAA